MNEGDLGINDLDIIIYDDSINDTSYWKLPGKVFFYVDFIGDDIEIHVFDYDNSAELIHEGVGFDYWIKTTFVDDGIKKSGYYVIENINISYHKDYYGEVDEDISFNSPREMTQKEIDELPETIEDVFKKLQSIDDEMLLREMLKGKNHET